MEGCGETYAELGDALGEVFDSRDVEVAVIGAFGVGAHSSAYGRLAGLARGGGGSGDRTTVDDRLARRHARHGRVREVGECYRWDI